MLTTNTKGQVAQCKAELRAIELGLIPSKPIFDTRYDLILDNGKKLQRIQIKYAGQQRYGAAIAKLRYENRTGGFKDYSYGEVDGLIVYLPGIDRLCFFTPEQFINKSVLIIRLKKPKNNQTKNIIMAEDYFW